MSAVNKRKSLECCDLKQYNKGCRKFTNISSRVKNKREVALVVCFRLWQALNRGSIQSASGGYLQDVLEVRQRHFLEDSLALEKRMGPAVSARFLRMRRGGGTRLRDGIPGGFYLQQGGGRQLIHVMKGHVIVLGKKSWKVPHLEGEDNIQVVNNCELDGGRYLKRD